MSDEKLNAAIDEAARQMTEGSAAGLRHRVIARIESGDAPRRPWRAAFVLPPLAAAAAIVVALLVARGRAPAGPSAPAAAESATRPQPSSREPSVETATAASRPVHVAVAPRSGIRKPDTANALQLERLDVAPLAVGSLTPDPIRIEQLGAIAPMAIAPLEITDESKER